MNDGSRATEEGKLGFIESIVPWIALVGGTAFAVVWVIGTTISMLFDDNLYRIALGNLPTLLGLPCSALGSLCLVIFLKTANGPIEFEALGFKFRGASGPIIMWGLCFLSMILGIHTLWRWPA
jgi:hypothetical protein